MQIHNYFSDLLMSVRVLFDNIIFRGARTIKYYEFNIANRTFVLAKKNYKTNYELPAALVTLNDDNFNFGERPNISLMLHSANFNQLPVLFDEDTALRIDVQEEHTLVSIGIVINCESQLQAKDIEYRIRRYLPVGKFIELFNFTSFLEVPPELLMSMGMDYNKHTIQNLFTKLNRNTGNMEYCFSMNYRPQIRLDTSTVSITAADQRSFTVNLDISYQVQMPMFILSEQEFKNKVTKINMDFTRIGNEPISGVSTRLLITRDATGKFVKVLRNLVISHLDDHSIKYMNDKNYNYFIVQDYLNKNLITFKELENYLLDPVTTNVNLLNLINTNILSSGNLQSMMTSYCLKPVNYITNTVVMNNTNVKNIVINYLANNTTDASIYEMETILTNTIKLICADLLTHNDLKTILNGLLDPPNSNIDLSQCSKLDVLNSILIDNHITIKDIVNYYYDTTTKNSYLTTYLQDIKLTTVDIENLLIGLGYISNAKTPTFTNAFLGVHFDPSDFLFTKDQLFNFFDINWKLLEGIQPIYIDLITNNIYFIFTNTELINLTPSLVSPIVLQIYITPDLETEVGNNILKLPKCYQGIVKV